jgi:hypothetical protein
MPRVHAKHLLERATLLVGLFSALAWRAAPPLLAQTSYIVIQTETSDPPNLFPTLTTQTNYPPGSPSIYFQTQTARITPGSYHFTHWTLNGQRAQDYTGQSINPTPTVFTNDISAVAHYVLANQFTDDTLVPDWYKIQYFNTTNITAFDNPSDDGFNLATDYLRGYDPNLFNQVIENGVSRRRSASVLVIVNTNLIRVTATSAPDGVYSDVQILTRGTNYNLPAAPSYSGYGFIGWFVGTNRVDDPNGFSAGTLSFIVTNDTTFVAQFLPVGQDSDGDGLPDWYEMYYLNSLSNTPASNPRGDGFNIATDILRNYQPNVFNQIIENGISRRRSPSTLIVANTNLIRVAATSDPFGFYSDFQILTRGTNYNLPDAPSYSGYGFIGWFVGTNRVDDPNGFSSGTLSFVVTNDTTFTAKFLPVGQDGDGDGLPDWYEMYYFNSLSNSPLSNPSGDGFNIATDILRGYQPNVFNQVVENGISRRRSPVLPFVPAPPGFRAQPVAQTVSPGTNVTLSVVPQGIPPFTYQWRLNGMNIAGATNASLPISNAQPTSSGSYSVLVANSFGFNISTDAVLLVTSADLGLADNIENRPITNSFAGQGSGDNLNATHQIGEPNHDGKYGSNSVWLGWVAPANGIATFSTRGSSFDTVLAVYMRQTNALSVSVTNLTLITADDDRGGYLTSLVQFNATTGTEYLVVVDGFVHATGNIVLGWELQATTNQLPVILQQPDSQTVALGATASFSVLATSSLPLSYQWLLNGAPIAGATSPTLLLPNVQVVNVGNYRARVSNGTGESDSEIAFLQISIIGPSGGTEPVAALEKLADAPLAGSGPLVKSPHPLDADTSFGFTSPPARGISGTQIYSTFGNSTGNALAWFKLQATNSGPLLITTEGSQFDTLFTVYNGPSNAISPLQLSNVLFAYNGGTTFQTRRITFNSVSNTIYYIRLDGGSQYGLVWLSWVAGYQSAIQRSSGPQFGHTSFAIQTSNGLPASIQWFFNDQPLPGQTNLSLNLASIQPSSEGAYSVQLSSTTGVITRDKIYLRVLPILFGPPRLGGNGVSLHFGTTYGLPVQIQSSPDLSSWTTIYSNNAPGTNNNFVDPQPAGAGIKFYRFQFP